MRQPFLFPSEAPDGASPERIPVGRAGAPQPRGRPRGGRLDTAWDMLADRRSAALAWAAANAVPEAGPARPVEPLTGWQIVGRLGIGAAFGALVVLATAGR